MNGSILLATAVVLPEPATALVAMTMVVEFALTRSKSRPFRGCNQCAAVSRRI